MTVTGNGTKAQRPSRVIAELVPVLLWYCSHEHRIPTYECSQVRPRRLTGFVANPVPRSRARMRFRHSISSLVKVIAPCLVPGTLESSAPLDSPSESLVMAENSIYFQEESREGPGQRMSLNVVPITTAD